MSTSVLATKPDVALCVRDYSPDVEYQLVESDELESLSPNRLVLKFAGLPGAMTA